MYEVPIRATSTTKHRLISLVTCSGTRVYGNALMATHATEKHVIAVCGWPPTKPRTWKKSTPRCTTIFAFKWSVYIYRDETSVGMQRVNSGLNRDKCKSTSGIRTRDIKSTCLIGEHSKPLVHRHITQKVLVYNLCIMGSAYIICN